MKMARGVAAGRLIDSRPLSRFAQRILGGSTMNRFLPAAAVVLLTALPASSGESDACNIKGNVNTRGEKIYHVPGQEYYDETVIAASHGERWFCTEAEARDAGWRKSKV